MIGRSLPRIMRLRFPNLTDDNHSIMSPTSDNYNCIAWAYEDSNKVMWPGESPDYYWPTDVISADETRALIQLFLDAGYEECDTGEQEDGFKKVAIYGDEEGPHHAALQLASGRWTSKLGKLQDIEHDTLEVLEGKDYGWAFVFLKKRRD